jgi:hypothetical protein
MAELYLSGNFFFLPFVAEKVEISHQDQQAVSQVLILTEQQEVLVALKKMSPRLSGLLKIFSCSYNSDGKNLNSKHPYTHK